MKVIINPGLYNNFPLRSVDYNLRHQTDFYVNCFYTHFRLNSLRYFASKVWNMVPPELKNLNDVETFISQVRDGSKNNANANCHIYKTQAL